MKLKTFRTIQKHFDIGRLHYKNEIKERQIDQRTVKSISNNVLEVEVYYYSFNLLYKIIEKIFPL